jgi:predicted 3-demethylubiquinone-9 3-methyltransferase (glyoxalase superfamily)
MITPIQKLVTYLWIENDNVEEMVDFYESVFKENFSRGDKAYNVTETPGGKPVGSILVHEFDIFGHRFSALNGGPMFKFNESISFQILCEDQEEIDYYWEKLSAVPESEVCGWLKDKFGVSWQISPKMLDDIMKSDDKEAAKRATDVMLKMSKIVIADIEKAYAGE